MRLEFKINLEKKYAFMIIGVVLLMAAIIGVVAYNSGGPASRVGHSGEEVDVTIGGTTKPLNDAIGPDIQKRVSGTCPAGQSIRVIDETGAVTCEVDDVGGGGGCTQIATLGTGKAVLVQVLL